MSNHTINEDEIMRTYKQVKEKKVIYSLDEWKQIEERAASIMMKTGT